MNAVDIIIKKRDGAELSEAEIAFFVNGITSGDIPDYQAAAWAMAVYFQSMSDVETTALTLAMAASGEQLDLHDSVAPGTLIVDKHSSGGVGDKTTLAVAPIVAACGLPVGKMSGRGLSFSGGTIDKLESIPGWTAELDEASFRRQLQTVGLVIAGQTADLAPADRLLYALRDVTGTVPSLPLIAASIMSKKIAAGADAIVLDVKCGRGAFMETRADARALAKQMVAIGAGAGRRMTALITQMEQPLGRAVGNALEVKEAIATLQGTGPADSQTLVEEIALNMLLLAEPEGNPATLRGRVHTAIRSGAALDKLCEFVRAQGGDDGVIRHPERLPQAPKQAQIVAPAAGTVAVIDARAVGLTAVMLGGGRMQKGDPVDHAVGIELEVKVGDRVAAHAPLATVYAADDQALAAAGDRIRQAIEIGAAPIAALPIIYEKIASAATTP